MSNITFDINMGEDEGSAVFWIEGQTYFVDQSHPNFLKITAALASLQDPRDLLVVEEADIEDAVKLDERVSVVDGVIIFDGEPVHSHLANTIVRYLTEGRDTTGLVRFLERLNENPSKRARDELFSWSQAVSLTIDEDGYFIGYKAVRADGTSITAGPGIVNGVAMNGHLPNDEGNIVEVDRKNVDDDFRHACSVGLHVGNYSYASTFGPRLLEVKVDPADVVSIPSDSGWAKLRTCKYKVLKLHDLPEDDLSWYEPGPEFDEDEFLDEDLQPLVPQGFFDRLRERFGKKR